jgi:hypothetical protein
LDTQSSVIGRDDETFHAGAVAAKSMLAISNNYVRLHHFFSNQ